MKTFIILIDFVKLYNTGSLAQISYSCYINFEFVCMRNFYELIVLDFNYILDMIMKKDTKQTHTVI